MIAKVDLNADLGEGAPNDAALMAIVTSVNIACGAHAGDEDTFLRTAQMALKAGVGIGAHPGYDDREHFGRRELDMPASDVEHLVGEQLRMAVRVAGCAGAALGHVKLHGGLYNQAMRLRPLAEAFIRAVKAVDAGLVVVGLPNSEVTRVGAEAGLKVCCEVFADRTYQADGSLTPRSQADAFVHDPYQAAARVARMIREGRVVSRDGRDLPIHADTVCLHGDGPSAVAFATSIRSSLRKDGILLQYYGRRGR